MVVDIKVKDKIEMKIPKRGWYIKLCWTLDYDECIDEVYGPIPENRKDLVIELINVLLGMIDETYDKDPTEIDYGNVPGVNKFFDFKFEGVDTDSEDFSIIDDLGLITVREDVDYNIGVLDSFDCTWHDGIGVEDYDVELVDKEG